MLKLPGRFALSAHTPSAIASASNPQTNNEGVWTLGKV